MGESGIYKRGNSRDQGDNQGSDRYLRLSLEGRWLALARAWLRDNCPCDIAHYYGSVCPLMPTHIAGCRNTKDPQLKAAKSALARLKKGYPAKNSPPVVEVCDDRIVYIGEKLRESVLYDHSWMPLVLGSGYEVDLKSLGRSVKEMRSAAEMLRRRGCKCIGNWVYRYEN